MIISDIACMGCNDWLRKISIVGNWEHVETSLKLQSSFRGSQSGSRTPFMPVFGSY